MRKRSNKSMPEEELQNWLLDAEKVVVAGIGNPLRKDDFVGTKIVRGLQKKTSSAVCLIECETVPESFIQPIIEFKPTHILLIDAALLNQKPGSFRLVDPEELANFPAVSTHALPLRMFCDYLKKTTQAKIALLAIQPKEGDFGEGLTQELKKTAKRLIRFLLQILP
ncbi:MAG: hydrogenase 3 maturation endopeptidase HyCI [Thermoproteota archaeon]|nr:hydrogenase 3 maturation endopeptidase HyCI [Thermoproteota archaeon]